LQFSGDGVHEAVGPITRRRNAPSVSLNFWVLRDRVLPVKCKSLAHDFDKRSDPGDNIADEVKHRAATDRE
jgi:hypothetical protein